MRLGPSSAALVEFESLIKQLGRDPKVGILEARKGILQFEQSSVGGQFKYSDCSGESDAKVRRGFAPAYLINEQQVRLQLLGKADGSDLPGVERRNRLQLRRHSLKKPVGRAAMKSRTA